jgi:predicted nucleic acid-binding protein
MRLFDTSAWTWRTSPVVDSCFGKEFAAGDLALCEMVALEILSGSPNRNWYNQVHERLSSAPWVHMGSDEWRRALEVHALLERMLGTNARRGVKHADLLIAAAAETHSLELVHYDQDFELIQQVTGQPMSWIAPRGSL